MKLSHLAKIVCFLSLLASFSQNRVYADDVYQVIIKKQKKKKKYRWSIEQWFETRNKMRLQDLWFAMNAPSPYEFFLGAEHIFSKTTGSPALEVNRWRVHVGGYASIVGLEGEWESLLGKWSAIFGLRIFGYYVQSTHVTFHMGIRSQTNPTTYRDLFAGGFATLYLTKFAGAELKYRYFFHTFDNDAGIQREGNRFDLTGFIDFKALRIFGTYYIEKETPKAGPVGQSNDQVGFSIGAKLFF